MICFVHWLHMVVGQVGSFPVSPGFLRQSSILSSFSSVILERDKRNTPSLRQVKSKSTLIFDTSSKEK